jgi:hypothetical protein
LLWIKSTIETCLIACRSKNPILLKFDCLFKWRHCNEKTSHAKSWTDYGPDGVGRLGECTDQRSINLQRHPAGDQICRSRIEGSARAEEFVHLWGYFDFMWYPEASVKSGGYVGVQDFINPLYPPMSATEDGQVQLLMSIKDYVDGKSPNGRLTPLDAASLMEQYASTGLANVQGLNPGTNMDLRETIVDVKAMASLGLYYLQKIRGAVDLYRYQKNAADTASLVSARDHLQKSAKYRRDYATQWSSQYLPQRLGRVNQVVDMVALQASVDKDIPGGAVSAPAPAPTVAYDVNSLVLVNASNGVANRPLQASQTISLSNLGVPGISIQALANAGTKSVKFAGAGVSRVSASRATSCPIALRSKYEI